MRSLFMGAMIVVTLCVAPQISFAQGVPFDDGCSSDDGYYRCKPGARPGVPYQRQRGGDRYQRNGGVSDGCAPDRYGRMVCRPGARPGVPYNRGRGYDDAGDRDNNRRGGNFSDGCARDRYGRMVCRPGAQPGVPYYGQN